eukprot:8913550-Ditylum_brightwellii.AAC.1
MVLSLSQDNVGDEDIVGDKDSAGNGEKDSEKIFIGQAICMGVMRRGCNSDNGDGLAILRRWPLLVP